MADRIDWRRRTCPLSSINHTDLDSLMSRPIVVSIEPKRDGGSLEQAQLQAGTWQAAQFCSVPRPFSIVTALLCSTSAIAFPSRYYLHTSSPTLPVRGQGYLQPSDNPGYGTASMSSHRISNMHANLESGEKCSLALVEGIEYHARALQVVYCSTLASISRNA